MFIVCMIMYNFVCFSFYSPLGGNKEYIYSPQFSVASHPKNSGACLDSTTEKTEAMPNVTAVNQ